MTTEPRIAAPEPTRDSQPYWGALARHELMFQRCADCGTWRHYPRPVCTHCFSLRSEWQRASGRGTLHSWTTIHHAYDSALRGETPYLIGIADMEESVRLACRLVPPDGMSPSIGLPLRVGFTDQAGGFTLPVLHPAGG
ncbi:OB-fold domain-containing protein [Hoeflea sp. CAU 1731]|jgi:uncharacterized OB-fold protein|nr:OB-fold domain-containing protein [Paracoccaceae bacterium]